MRIRPAMAPARGTCWPGGGRAGGARSVSDARARIGSLVSVQVRFAHRLGAPPHPLHPDQRHRPARCRQIPHPHRPPGMQSRRDAAAPAELLPTTSSFDRLLELAVDLRDSQQNKARQTQHRRRRATVTLHLGLLVRVLNHRGS